MGSSCSIRGGHHRVAPGDYPAARRVLFCGMGRSGKSTLIEWVVNATKTAADNNNTTVTQGGILSTATTVPSPPRTTTTALHLYKDQSLALVDTPNMLELDGQTVVLDASAQDRVAAIVFVVDVTDHIRAVLAEELLHNTLQRLQARARLKMLVLIVGNRRYPDADVLVDIETFKSSLPSIIMSHYTVRTMSFSTAQDVGILTHNLE